VCRGEDTLTKSFLIGFEEYALQNLSSKSDREAFILSIYMVGWWETQICAHGNESIRFKIEFTDGL
jgi:hypothetical protein